MNKLLPAAALLLGIIAYHTLKPAPEPGAAAAPSSPAPSSPGTEKTVLHTNEGAVEVFRRAFWRDPSPADRILHAERREWISEGDNVRRWQWFLALEPSPSLTTWLRDSNPFNLTRKEPTSQPPAPGIPTWFPSGPALTGCEIQQSPNQAMTLIFDTGKNRLYATDQGHGFALSQSSSAQATPASAPQLIPPARAQPSTP